MNFRNIVEMLYCTFQGGPSDKKDLDLDTTNAIPHTCTSFDDPVVKYISNKHMHPIKTTVIFTDQS